MTPSAPVARAAFAVERSRTPNPTRTGSVGFPARAARTSGASSVAPWARPRLVLYPGNEVKKATRLPRDSPDAFQFDPRRREQDQVEPRRACGASPGRRFLEGEVGNDEARGACVVQAPPPPETTHGTRPDSHTSSRPSGGSPGSDSHRIEQVPPRRSGGDGTPGRGLQDRTIRDRVRERKPEFERVSSPGAERRDQGAKVRPSPSIDQHVRDEQGTVGPIRSERATQTHRAPPRGPCPRVPRG